MSNTDSYRTGIQAALPFTASSLYETPTVDIFTVDEDGAFAATVATITAFGGFADWEDEDGDIDEDLLEAAYYDALEDAGYLPTETDSLDPLAPREYRLVNIRKVG